MADIRNVEELTEATYIGWAISAVVGPVISKTQIYMSNEYSTKARINGNLKEIETNLKEILPVIATVEKHKVVKQRNARFVREIRDAVYDAEDIVDELEYSLLEKKLKKRLFSPTTPPWSKTSWFTVGDGNFRKEVNEVVGKLCRANDFSRFLLNSILEDVAIEQGSRYTTTTFSGGEIFGLSNECEKVINSFFEKEDDHSPTITTIVGQGGIGKTTLAQMVFIDDRVKCFDIRMWVHVSENFDEVGITKDMLMETGVHLNENFDKVGFEMLQENLRIALASKKMLLVLDDVWCPEDQDASLRKKWSELLAPLNSAKPGSKILVTTRFHLVARILGSVSSIYLNGLNDIDSWKLFEQCVFGDIDIDMDLRIRLESISKGIINKLRGSPLFIKVLAAQLRMSFNVNHWIEISDRNLSHFGKAINILRLSYEYLPAYLQRCYGYCSLFPKDSYLKPDQLVNMWIAHGFVVPQEGKSLEEVGRDYFNQLLARSFIRKNIQGDKLCYVMNDFMDDLASYISEGECFLLTESGSMENSNSIRHLSVYPEAIDKLLDFQGLEKLRTLIIFSGSVNLDKSKQKKIFSSLKSIRVLHIDCSSLRPANYIGLCIHLRYLSVPFSDSPLPGSIRKLHNLQVLFSV